VPNVIPQLIVLATMGLGEVILAEAVLSFLGLGVKFPLASWGNILESVNDVHVMTNYLYVWIPAGFCILITVLGFNFVGDGLRDAFDPKMNR
jgi:peptide/nickel transport system permease protein